MISKSHQILIFWDGESTRKQECRILFEFGAACYCYEINHGEIPVVPVAPVQFELPRVTNNFLGKKTVWCMRVFSKILMYGTYEPLGARMCLS